MPKTKLLDAAILVLGAAISVSTSTSSFGSTASPERFAIFEVPGALGTYPVAMNDSETIVGVYSTAVNVFHGFVRTGDGTISLFNLPGATGSSPTAINASGTIVGTYSDSKGVGHCFVRTAGGSVTSFDVPKAASTSVVGINAAGEVAGDYRDKAGIFYGFVRAPDGTITSFDVPGAVSGVLTFAINDNGEVSGSWGGQNTELGFVRMPNGKIREFNVAPKYPLQTEPESLNDAGTTAGHFISHLNRFVGFVRSADGTVVKLPTNLCPKGTLLNGINSAGEVAGYCERADGIFGLIRSPEGQIKLFRSHGMNTFPGGISAAGVVWGAVGSEGFVGTP